MNIVETDICLNIVAAVAVWFTFRKVAIALAPDVGNDCSRFLAAISHRRAEGLLLNRILWLRCDDRLRIAVRLWIAHNWQLIPGGDRLTLWLPACFHQVLVNKKEIVRNIPELYSADVLDIAQPIGTIFRRRPLGHHKLQHVAQDNRTLILAFDTEHGTGIDFFYCQLPTFHVLPVLLT